MIYHWKKIVRYSFPLLTICVFIEIGAGQILNLREEFLLSVPIFLVSIPVMNSVGGNIGCILGARLASGLHVGYISIDFRDKKMKENLITSLLLGLITYVLLAILIYGIAIFGYLHIDIGFMKFMAIILGAGFLLVCLISLVSVITAFLSFKKGLDPDDMIAPAVTTVGDTLGIIFLFFFIGVVGI